MNWSKRPPGSVVEGLSIRIVNQKACMASRKEEAGLAGTRRQMAAICSSSALRAGSVSSRAIRAASAA